MGALPARARKALGAINHAKTNPTLSNTVEAISALHDDIVANQRYQREVNVYLEAGINALLDRFGIARPSVSESERTRGMTDRGKG